MWVNVDVSITRQSITGDRSVVPGGRTNIYTQANILPTFPSAGYVRLRKGRKDLHLDLHQRSTSNAVCRLLSAGTTQEVITADKEINAQESLSGPVALRFGTPAVVVAWCARNFSCAGRRRESTLKRESSPGFCRNHRVIPTRPFPQPANPSGVKHAFKHQTVQRRRPAFSWERASKRGGISTRFVQPAKH